MNNIQRREFLAMINDIRNIQCSHLLVLGDFNLPKIDWSNWESITTNPEDLENNFLEYIRNCFLFQHVTSLTRGRSNNKPSLIDLIFTNEEGMISDLEILSPLGKSDHACLSLA